MLKRSCKQTEEKIGREMKNYRISLIIQNKFGKKKKQGLILSFYSRPIAGFAVLVSLTNLSVLLNLQ